MATYYELAGEPVVQLLEKATRDWHPELAEAGVKVGILMASADDDKPAVRHGGHGAFACISVVSYKDHITKQYDAEMLIDQDKWNLMNAARKLALLDHELSHLALKTKKVKRAKRDFDPPTIVERDALGRPKLVLRKGDWDVGDGFRDVVARHGGDAIEFANIERAYSCACEAKGGS